MIKCRRRRIDSVGGIGRSEYLNILGRLAGWLH